MQKIYFGMLMLFAMSLHGQEVTDVSYAPTTERLSFNLYPNPAFNDIVYVTTPTNGNKEIIVYDVFGEIVLTDRIRTNVLNISKLVSGVYVLQVTEAGNTMRRKLVVK